MAFTFAPNWTSAKYRYSFTGDEGTSYIWEIHEDGHNNGGSPTTIDASGRDNCITSWKNEGEDEYSPLMTSETKISLFDPSLNVVNDLLDALSTGSISDVEEKYRLVVRSGNNLKWVGNIDPEGITYEEDGVTQLSITATDGIGRLANKPYITNTATGALPNGIDSIKNIFVEILDYTGFDLDIYMSSSFYPKAMYSLPSQGVNSNPLEYIYANKYHFRDVQGINDSIQFYTPSEQELLSALGFLDPGDIDKDDRPISVHSALVALLKSFGLRVVQQDGIWHIIQCNHLAKATTYKKWKYDSTGAAIGSPNYEDVTSGLSISNITVARTRSRVSTLPSYSSSVVTYAHGSSNMIRLGQFGNITKARGAYSTTYPWIAGNSSLSARADRDGGFSGWHIDDVNEDPTQKTGFTRIGDFTGIFNFDDSSGSFTTSIGGRTASQTTNIESQSGDKLNLQFEVFPAPKGLTVGNVDLLGRETPEVSGDAFVAVQVKLNTSTPRYLQLVEPRAAEWTTTPTWMSWSRLSVQNWNSIFVTSNAVPSDATITVTLGPIFDGKGNQIGSCYYDNVALYPVESDGAISFTATSYVNYIDRADPRPRQHSVKFGDGPTAYTSGALYTASNRSAFTADWEEVLNTGGSASGHSGADTNEELAVVLGRAILRSTNRIRTVHDRSFNGAGQILLPLDVILDGSRYAPHSLDANWVEEYSSGSWIKLDENGFTDDLETGIKSGGSSLSDWGRGTGYNAGLVLNGLQQSFVSDNSKRITRTTAPIPAGNATASIDVEEIAEPLLNNNDTIVIISPTLEWYRVKISQDQLAAATEIFFDDPENPGSNFDFPNRIPTGANIFVADDELLTLVRTGAQGFAVSVLGQDLGTVNEGSGVSASYTDIDVTDWITTVRAGSTIEVQQTDGSYVTAQLWADAYKGATNIQITLPGESDVQTSITMNLTSGKKISPTGSVSRADFTVTADAITSYISTDGDLIATIDTPAETGTNVSTDTDLTATLKAGDTVYFHGANTGRVFKRTVATVTGSDFTITSAFSGDDTVAVGDYVFGGTIVGMRIDADGVDFVNTHIKSDNWASSGGVIDDDPASATYGEITTNGTQGWVITRSGEAEFNNAIIRGKIDVGGIRIGKDVGYLTGEGDEPTAGEHGIWINADNYWILDTNADPDEEFFRVGDANSHINWDGTTDSEAFTIKSRGSVVFDSSSGTNGLGLDGDLEIVDGRIVIGSTPDVVLDSDGLVLSTGSANVNKVRWTTGGASPTYSEIYTSGPGVMVLNPLTDLSVTADSLKINPGVIRLLGTSDSGEAGWVTMYANTSGYLFRRNGTGADHRIIDNDLLPVATGANGDILYYNSGWQKLAKGLDGEVLTLASGLPTWAAAGGGVSYQPLDSDLTAIAALTPTTGQIIFAQSGSWTSLPIGTAGTFLKSSFGTPSWTSIVESDISNLGNTILLNSDIGSTVQGYSANLTSLASDPITASTAASTYQPLDDALSDIAGISTSQGDLLYGLATNSGWAKLPLGSAGTFLKSSFGTPSWTGIVEADISDLGTTIVLDSDIGSTVQAYSANLTSLASDPLTATTAAATYQPLDADLTDIAALSVGNGQILTTTTADGYTLLPAGTNGYFLKMSFGTPSWHPSTDIVALGTVTTGTWQATAIADSYIASATTWNGKLSDITGEAIDDLANVTITTATAGDVLRYNGSAWVNYPDSNYISSGDIGSTVQAWDADLDDIAALAKGNGQLLTTTTADGYVLLPAGSNGQFLKMSFGTPSWHDTTDITALGTITAGTWNANAIGDSYISSAATWNAKLGSGDIGVSVQAYDDALSDIAGINTSQGDLLYGLATNSGWTSLPLGASGTFLKSSLGTPSWSSIEESDISNLGTSIVLDTDIGSTVQGYSANLTSLAADPLTATTAASTYQPLDSNLTQISAISPSNGGLITFAGGSYSQLPAGTNGYFLKMSFGTPSWHPSTDITQVGIISSGTWRGTAIEDTYIGSHTHAASDITSGTFANARISESSVTQHEGALSITESQISDLGSYITNQKGVANLYSRYGQITVNSTTAVDFLGNSGSYVGTSTVPANSVLQGSIFRIVARGTRQGNGSDSHTYTLKIGSTTLLTYTYTPTNTFGGYDGWKFEAIVSVNATGSSGTVWAQGQFHNANNIYMFENTATDSYNTTSATDISLEVSTNTNTTATCEVAYIDVSRSSSVV